jgi:transcriptional regulator GlxA family with amidase domain
MNARSNERTSVGILIFPDVEVLDFTGPFEVFSVARRDESRRREEPSPFDVHLVAETDAAVCATGGLRVLPHFTLEACPRLDVLITPGGWGTRELVNNGRLIHWIRERAGQASIVASVCTGSFLLAQAGLLGGRRATTHWASLDRLVDAFPDVQVVRDVNVVDDGCISTSAGISAGIDLALRLVARIEGETVARASARHMEYPYPDSNARRV